MVVIDRFHCILSIQLIRIGSFEKHTARYIENRKKEDYYILDSHLTEYTQPAFTHIAISFLYLFSTLHNDNDNMD